MKRSDFVQRRYDAPDDGIISGAHQKIIRSLRRAIEALAPYTTHRTGCAEYDRGQPCSCGLAERLAVAQRLCIPGTFNQRMRTTGPPVLIPGGGKHVPLHAIADLPPQLPPTPKRAASSLTAPAPKSADERLLASIRHHAAHQPAEPPPETKRRRRRPGELPHYGGFGDV
jgi:hypothetical protein